MKQRGGATNGMLLFLMYGTFALFSLFIILIGARVYRDLVTTGAETSNTRSAFSYVLNKVRTNGNAEGVRVENRGNLPVLLLQDSFNGADYETVIYLHDGALREVLLPAGQQFAPEAGQEIAPASNFKVERQERGLLLTVADVNGTPRQTYIDLTYGGEQGTDA